MRATHIHTYTHTHMHTYTQTHRYTDTQTHIHTDTHTAAERPEYRISRLDANPLIGIALWPYEIHRVQNLVW